MCITQLTAKCLQQKVYSRQCASHDLQQTTYSRQSHNLQQTSYSRQCASHNLEQTVCSCSEASNFCILSIMVPIICCIWFMCLTKADWVSKCSLTSAQEVPATGSVSCSASVAILAVPDTMVATKQRKTLVYLVRPQRNYEKEKTER